MTTRQSSNDSRRQRVSRALIGLLVVLTLVAASVRLTSSPAPRVADPNLCALKQLIVDR
jgi:hypothetical protein